MENNQFSNFKYDVFDSTHEGVCEVVVTFDYGDKSVRRIIFCHNKSNAACINEAKKIIKNELETGKLIKYAKKYVRSPRRVNAGLKIALAVSCAAAVGLAGFCTYLYLNPKGGDTPSGETVKVGLSTEAKEAIEIDKEEAVIGKEFIAKITVKEENMQIIDMMIKSGDKELKVTDDYEYKPITSNDKLTYTLKINADSVTGIIQILKVDLAPVGEDWKTITVEKAVEIAKNCVSQEAVNVKRIASLLRSKGAQGKLTTSIEETTAGSETKNGDTLEFDLRSIDKPIDKDIYVKRMSENDKLQEWSKNYAVYLPNSKNPSISDTGIYFFSADDKSPNPIASKTEIAHCSETNIEEKLNLYASQVFGKKSLSCLLEGGIEGLTALSSLIDLFNEEKHPEFKSGEFKSKDDQSLLCSFEGTYDFSPLANDDPSMRLNVKVINARFTDFICSEGLIDVNVASGGTEVMSAAMNIKLDYGDVINEYNSDWQINE